MQCLAYQQSSNESQIEVVATACSMQYIILNVHTVCDVIIARSCGTLPGICGHYIPAYVGVSDAVVNTFMFENSRVLQLEVRQ